MSKNTAQNQPQIHPILGKIEPPIILASQSPRRKELLQQIGLRFTTISSNFPEKIQLDEEVSTPEQLALYNARGKALEIASKYPDAIIIGADTVVSYQNHILGKPNSSEDAARMLKLLSGTTHKVITGLTLALNDQLHEGAETTLVTINKLTEAEIRAYVASGEGDDKAAACAIQGLGALFTSKVEGDYFNVVGLPLNLLGKMLKKFT